MIPTAEGGDPRRSEVGIAAVRSGSAQSGKSSPAGSPISEPRGHSARLRAASLSRYKFAAAQVPASLSPSGSNRIVCPETRCRRRWGCISSLEVVMRPPKVFVRSLSHQDAVRLKRMSTRAQPPIKDDQNGPAPDRLDAWRRRLGNVQHRYEYAPRLLRRRPPSRPPQRSTK
jgi:hypothetical protein